MAIRPHFFSKSIVAVLICSLLIAGYIAAAHADDSGSISGVVSNSQNGRPIEGATISIYPAAGPVLMRTKTNQSGHYAAVGLQPGAYSVFFTKDGMNSVEGRFEICPGAQTSMSVRLSVSCSAGCIGRPASRISPTSTTTALLYRSPGVANTYCH
jgi:hypothetical protein